MTNVCCVVTRYFGGTLLGTGGLVRAYTKAALALEAAGISQMALWTAFTLSLPYPFYERVQRLLAEYEAVTENADFGADVALDILVRSERADALAAALTDESAY